MTEHSLLVLPYSGTTPKFASAPRYARGAAVLGRVTMGAGAFLGEYSVIRADGHFVEVGDDFWLGAHGTVHIAHDVYPTHIGNKVTAGINAIIHACDVGSNCVIGRDVVILDGSKVADNVALADGAIVFPRSTLESGWLYAGQPAKPLRQLVPGELETMHTAARSAINEAGVAGARRPEIDEGGNLFLARTARASGRLSFGENVGVWFGCHLDAGVHSISVGGNTNIQDNTIIRCVDGPVFIGRETTIGHNVTMSDCTVADRSLIGMGAIVEAKTVVEEDVLLAAGARTSVGQTLEQGWLYGGSPARQLSKLDETKRRIIALTWPTYVEYARRFNEAQATIG